MQRMDRSAGRVVKLGQDDANDKIDTRYNAAQRIEQVWEVTRSVWAMVEPGNAPSRLPRHVGRVIRPQR